MRIDDIYIYPFIKNEWIYNVVKTNMKKIKAKN